MSMAFKPRKSPIVYSISIFIFLLIIVGSALLLLLHNIRNEASTDLDTQHTSAAKVGLLVQDIRPILQNPKAEKVRRRFKRSKYDEVWLMRMSGMIRRILRGPGSSPPRCTAKCGRCSPCKPVHVPVPPGTPVTTEYYPEAWRCKCGNKLYMP